jgi:hypothetical protein
VIIEETRTAWDNDESTGYKCSIEADATWSQLRRAVAFIRAKGDAQMEGGTQYTNGTDQDLGTEARMMVWDAEAALTRLDCGNPRERAGAELTRRRLTSQRVHDVRERHGLSYEEADGMVERVKDYLHECICTVRA